MDDKRLIRKPLLSASTVKYHYTPELSRPVLSFTSSSSVVERTLSIDINDSADAADSLSSFFLRVRAIEYKIMALRDSFQGLQARQARLHSKYSKSLSNIMDLDMSDLVSQALCIKLSLDAVERENEEERKLEGCEKGSHVDNIRTILTRRLRHDLSGFLSDLAALQEKLKESEKEDLRRMLFILKGETVSDETLEEMIETGRSQAVIRKAIQEQGFVHAVKEEGEGGKQQKKEEEAGAGEGEWKGGVQEEVQIQIKIGIDSVMEIEDRCESVRKLKQSMVVLQQAMLEVGEMVEVQGEQLGEIEKNMLESMSFIKVGVQELGEAKEHKASSRSYLVAIVVLLLAIAAVVALVLIVVYNVQ